MARVGEGGGSREKVTMRIEADPDNTPREDPEPRSAGSDDPFCVLVVGDFRGVATGAPADDLPPLEERRPVGVDRDDLDSALASFRPVAPIGLPKPEGDTAETPAAAAGISFERLEDFHPDRLLERLPLLHALREERARVARGGEHSEAIPTRGEDAGREGEGPPDEGAGATAEDQDAEPESEDLLDRILSSTAAGEGPSEPSPPETPVAGAGRGRAERKDRPPGPVVDLEEFVRRVSADHRVAGEDPERETVLAALDGEISLQLRRVLRHRAFRALEALWTGIAFLVRRVETGPALKLFLLQATPGEVTTAAQTGALAEIVSRGPGGTAAGASWALVLLDHGFGSAPEDMATLRALAEVGQGTGAAFLAEADPSILAMDPGGGGSTSPGDGPGGAPTADEADALPAPSTWQALRSHGGASHIGLLLPRFLVRLPYAPGDNPCESLDFSELEPGKPPDPATLTWGHPGFLATVLLAASFRRHGWALRPGTLTRVDGLPLALHPGEEGTVPLPTTEVLLDDDEVAALVQDGFMPVISRPGEGSARIASFRSLSASGTPLKGPWGEGR